MNKIQEEIAFQITDEHCEWSQAAEYNKPYCFIGANYDIKPVYISIFEDGKIVLGYHSHAEDRNISFSLQDARKYFKKHWKMKNFE